MDSDEVLLRTSVPLEPAVLAEIEARVSRSLGHDVKLEMRVDENLRGATLVLDERRQIRVDPHTPLGGLEHRLSRLPRTESLESRVALTERVIQDYEPGPAATLGDTNLRRALTSFQGTDVRLVTRIELAEELIERIRTKLESASGRELDLKVQVDPKLRESAILELGDERRLVLDARYQFLADLERALQDEVEDVAPDEVTELLRRVIASTSPELRVEELLDTGELIQVGDGVALVSGIRGVGSQEVVEFEGGVFGIALSLNDHEVGCILLGSEYGLHQGGRVRRTGHLLKVPVGDGMLGRVVNSLGVPIDGSGPVEADGYLPVEREAPGVVDRTPVTVPLHTGIKVIDALVPLGRGQRELLLGDRKVGKTVAALDAILAQKDTGVMCVYAAIGQKASTVANVVRTLRENGALSHTVVVASFAGEQPAFRYIAPYSACAIAEHFMDSGKDALVVYDDLSKHAVTYREMSSLLKRPVGREAYPGDVFFVHSRLLERAARLLPEAGGGSLTALPIVETQAGDISAFIPTNVVSICDGQIVLDSALFNEGYKPALDVGLSVSRVGGAAQTPAMKKVAGRLRLDLAQYHEMAQFVKFGAEVDAATERQLARGERARELLKQGQHRPMSRAKQIAVLYAVTNGYLDEVPLERVRVWEQYFTSYLDERQTALQDSLERADAAIDKETEASLADALKDFAARHPEA